MNYLKLISRRTLQVLFDIIFLNFMKKGEHKTGSKKKVCLLRLDGLGDVVMFIDAIRAYREIFRVEDHETILITEAWIAPLFEECPYLDKVIGCDTLRFKKEISYRWQFLREIRKAGNHIFINSCINRELLYGDIMAHASGARHRYGYNAPSYKACEKIIGDLFYTSLALRPEDVHEVDKNAELVRLAGRKAYRPARPFMDWFGSPGKQKFFVIAPGAKDPARKWPQDRFASLSKALHEEFGLTPVIIGGKEDIITAKAIIKAAPKIPFQNETGRLDLPSVAKLVSGASFFIGNDSGPAHLSAATGTKTFVVATGGNFNSCVSYPEYLGLDHTPVYQEDTSCFNCHGKCKYKYNEILPCVENITVEQARGVIIRKLNEKKGAYQERAAF